MTHSSLVMADESSAFADDLHAPKTPHAPKAATAIGLWAEKRAQLLNGEIDAEEYEDWKASL